MTTVHRLPTPTEAVTLQTAVAAFLDTFSRPEQSGTRRTYAAVLTTHLLRAPLPRTDPVGMLDHPAVAPQLADWFAQRWSAAGAATWNRNLDCLHSARTYWRSQHWTPPTRPPGWRARSCHPPGPGPAPGPRSPIC